MISFPHKNLMVALSLLLVGTASFALGKISNIVNSREPIKIEYGDTLTGAVTEVIASTDKTTEIKSAQTPQEPAHTVFGSKSGKYYYLPDCSSRVKDKMWFSTISEAEARGFKPAPTCKGLQ